MSTRTITFEVDTGQLFDMLKSVGGDFSAIGNRVVEAMLAEPDFALSIGMAVYGITIVPPAAHLLSEQSND